MREAFEPDIYEKEEFIKDSYTKLLFRYSNFGMFKMHMKVSWEKLN
jgi:hypothetical protein